MTARLVDNYDWINVDPYRREVSRELAFLGSEMGRFAYSGYMTKHIFIHRLRISLWR
jgi:hypothetical protein